MKHLLIITTLINITPFAYAADIEAGKAKAASCAACHGPSGISSNSEWPNLAGQKAKYLENQIIAFRDGKRKNALMEPMVKNLSDEDVKNIAAYYESLKP